VFLPSTYHAKPVFRVCDKPIVPRYMEAGQFDDVSDNEPFENDATIQLCVASQQRGNHSLEEHGRQFNHAAKIS